MTKKFIQFSNFFYPLVGGQERVVMDLASTMRSKGFECKVVQPLNFAIIKDWKKFKRFQHENKIKVIALPTFALLFYPLLKLLALQRSSDWIKFINWVSFNFSLRLYSYFADRCEVYMCHYHFLYDPLKKLNPIIFSHGVEWQRPPKTLLDKLRVSKLELLIKSDKASLFVIANDQDYLTEIKNIASDNTNVKSVFIPNGVDTKLFTPSENLRNCEAKSIAMVRNVRQDRGILEGIKAFEVFCKEVMKSYQLEIYGHYDVNSTYFQDCLKEAQNCLFGTVNFHGPISNEQLAAIYPTLYLTLVPSQSLEGTSLAALESMSCGVPCVATPVGGLNDLPVFRAKSKAPEDLADAMRAVSLNYEEISRAQYRETMDNFSKFEWEKKVHYFLRERFCDEE